MYQAIHPSYKKAWGSDLITLENIQEWQGLGLGAAKRLAASLLMLGYIVQIQEDTSINLDLNGDGLFDKGDLTKAGSILVKGKKKRKKNNGNN